MKEKKENKKSRGRTRCPLPLRTGSGALPKESGTCGDSPAFGVLRTLVLSHPLPGTAQHGSARPYPGPGSPRPCAPSGR